MKISNLSERELLHCTDIALKAAQAVPDLRSQLRSYSYTEAKIKTGLDLVRQAEIWQGRQKTTQSQARQAQRTFKDVQRSVKALYGSHLEVARFAYRHDKERQQELRLTGSRSVRYSEWRSMVDTFYAQVDPQALTRFAVPAAELNEVKKLLSKLSELEVLRNDARRQAQQSTQRKRAVMQELRAWFSHFVRTARLACTDDPQLLEAMGIVVPS